MISFSSFISQLSLSFVQFYSKSLKLLLLGLNILHIPQNPLPGIIIILLHIFHFLRNSFNNFRFPISQFLQFFIIIDIQFFLITPDLNFVSFLFLHPDVGDLVVSNSFDLFLKLFFVAFILFVFVFDKSLLGLFDCSMP